MDGGVLTQQKLILPELLLLLQFSFNTSVKTLVKSNGLVVSFSASSFVITCRNTDHDG